MRIQSNYINVYRLLEKYRLLTDASFLSLFFHKYSSLKCFVTNPEEKILTGID